jgi:N utilization substance protein B
MQALYSFFQHEKGNTALFEKELFKSLDKIYDLYLSILALLIDLQHVSLVIIDEKKNKRLPTESDINPNLRFAQNSVLESLSQNKDLRALLDKKKISWQNDFDVVRRLFNEIRDSEIYLNYMKSETHSAKEDREFIIDVLTDYLSENEVLLSLFEEQNIHWADDTFVAFNSVIRSMEDFEGNYKVQALLKDEKDDLEFMSVLFNKVVLYRPQLDEIIAHHTQNWELERIAAMDTLLMEMALSEILYLPNIPIKASLNEYIDISKEYSTPNSKTFVNGVLDKAIAQLKSENKIQKTGRGLKEN